MGKFPQYKREFKYTSELKENTAYMLLGHPIGFDPKAKSPFIIGAIFAEEIYFWHSQGKEICVKINCPGGSIMDGFSIMDAIRTADAETVGVGVVASMAVHIMLSARKEKRSCVSYARAMIHGPQGGSDPVISEAFRSALAQVLNETTKFSKAEVEEMLKDGAPDTWLTAKEMKSKGLVSKIVSVNEEPEEVEENDPYVLYNVFNKLIEKSMAKPEEMSLDQSLKAFADLQNSLNEKAATITAKDTEIANLKNEIEQLKNADKAAKEAAAKAKVEVAIKNKQIVIAEGNTTLRAQYEKAALETPELFEAMIAAKPATAQRASVVAHIKSEATVTDADETYEYLANHNPKKLYDIMDNEPEKYNKLVAAWTNKVQNQKQA